ncbi:MAG: hypothetical protein EOL87_03445 [Spartobacteria bacterium]|nr:hypothetical protein [Spartobacteria bacterium]
MTNSKSLKAATEKHVDVRCDGSNIIDRIRSLFMSDRPWGLLLLIFLVRIPLLGKATLWQDEIGFVKLADPRLPFADMLSDSWNLVLSIGQLPLTFLFWNAYLKVVVQFVPDAMFNPFWTRLPAVFLGILGAWFLNRLARRLLSPRAAASSMFLYAFLFFYVYYAREVYCYAVILFLAPFSLYFYFKLLFDDKFRWTSFVWAVLGFTALSYSHLGCVMLLGSAGATTLLFWLYAWLFAHNRPLTRRLFIGGLSLALALMAIAPFLLRFVFYNTAHTSGSPHSFFVILNDVVAKLLLGEQLWLAIVAWVFFVCGLIWIIKPDTKSMERRIFAGIVVLSMVLLAWATHRSQYLSARYFSPVAPFIVLLYGAGITALTVVAENIFPKLKRLGLNFVVTGVIIVYSFFAYLVPLYHLNNKDVGFKRIADWLNANLPAGTPYVMESAYELRWVGGFYQTPNLVAAAPFVHGAAPNDMQILHNRQKEFISRFPISCFVESAHHGAERGGAMVWPWPASFYMRHAVLENPELQALVRRGIWTGEPYMQVNEYSFRTDFYYNKEEDLAAASKKLGRVVYADYPSEWRCVAYEQHPQGLFANYARIIEHAAGQFMLKPVDANTTHAGMLELSCALVPQTQQSPRTTLHVQIGKQQWTFENVAFGKFVNIKTPQFELPQEGATVTITVNNRNMPASIILYDATFVSEKQDGGQ